MIIIRLQGGIGNQMFQYALYRELLARGRDVKIDDVSGYEHDDKRTPQLAEVFGIDYAHATPEEVAEMTDTGRGLAERLRRMFTGAKSRMVTESADGNFEPDILERDDVFLNGYWQSEKYFPDAAVQQNLRKAFALDAEKVIRSQEVWEALSKIRGTESVSVHIRRGDYVEPGFIDVYGGICTEEYYKSAVEYLLERAPRSVFYLFSDDRAWAKQHFDGSRFVLVGGENVLSEGEDLLLMSECRHNIIANSSFSWWASWMNRHTDKRIIAPKKWLNTKQLTDIYTDRMVKL